MPSGSEVGSREDSTRIPFGFQSDSERLARGRALQPQVQPHLHAEIGRRPHPSSRSDRRGSRHRRRRINRDRLDGWLTSFALRRWLLMPVESTDVPAFVGLALRLRRETHGCGAWDQHGAEVVFARDLVGLNFRTALELIIAHSCDPEAKTPAAIKRPFSPEPGVERGPAGSGITAANQCRECGHVAGRCHPSCPGANVRPLSSDPEVNASGKAAALARISGELRQGPMEAT